MAFAQEKAEKYFVADPEPWQKAEKGQRHPAHNPRSLPVCVHGRAFLERSSGYNFRTWLASRQSGKALTLLANQGFKR